MGNPNILVIMTDEERCPPPYETDSVKAFRKNHPVARARVTHRAI